MTKITDKPNCPICNSLLKEYHDYMDHILMEHGQDCENCKQYFYQFVTGGTQILVGDETWSWYYDTDWEEIRQFQDEIDKKIEELKVHYAKT